MKPLHTRLQEARKHLGIPWEVLERDYILSWILAAITEVQGLEGTLIFKGGTALKKCYFGDYRFSEDLDFSGMENVPTGEAMEEAMRETCEVAVSMLDEYAPIEILCERYTEREPHPGGQEAFTIRARLPWHRTPQTRVMIEIAVDEKILKPIQERTVIHNYGEPLKINVKTYALKEIIAEKLRAILQHVQQLHTRGWSRSRARDYYDLWRVLNAYRERLNLSNFSAFLREKCALRSVSYKGTDDFFPETMLKDVERTWDQGLGRLVPNLPAFGTVIGELYPQIASLIVCAQ